jgi:hypothetical protein
MKIIKYALILGSLLVSSAGFAQSIATTPVATALPTASTLSTINATSPNETAAGAVETTNKVYIDQAGNNVNVNIQQTGLSNITGTSANPIYLRGDNQTVNVVQTGNSNSLLMGIVGGTGGTNAGTITTIQQLGNNNVAVISCGTAQGDTNCNNLNLNDLFAGNNNSLNFHGSAINITQTINTNGNNNTFNVTDSSPNSSQTLLFTGDNNTINVTQTDAGGTYGHSLYANFTGTGNTLTTQQYGVSETVINITSTGNNGNFQIKTGH